MSCDITGSGRQDLNLRILPALLDQARADLEEAEQTVADTQQRLGQPFRHAQALADAEEDLTRVETQLAGRHGITRDERRAGAADAVNTGMSL
ncbi:MAG: hypothetical protein QM635_00835 [Microbacteriaceae bacterium]